MGNQSKSTSLEYWLLPTDAVIPEDFWRATLETESEEGRKCNRERERFKEDERDNERERERGREGEREREREGEREGEREKQRERMESRRILLLLRGIPYALRHRENACTWMPAGRRAWARLAPAVLPTRPPPLLSPLSFVLSPFRCPCYCFVLSSSFASPAPRTPSLPS